MSERAEDSTGPPDRSPGALEDAGASSSDTPVITLAARWHDAWSAREPGRFRDICTPDVRYEDPVALEPLQGIDALARHVERLWTAFPDLRAERTAPPLHGVGHACLPWRIAGTHRGDLGGLPATERFVALHGLHYVELDGGRIRRARGFFDLYDAGVQLGMLPTRGGLGETALLLLRGYGLRPRA